MSQVHSRIFSRRWINDQMANDRSPSQVTLTQSDLLVWNNRWPWRVNSVQWWYKPYGMLCHCDCDTCETLS